MLGASWDGVGHVCVLTVRFSSGAHEQGGYAKVLDGG